MNNDRVAFGALLSPLVEAMWWFLVERESYLESLPFAALYFLSFVVVSIVLWLGPLAGIGAMAYGGMLLRWGWRSAWYAIPGLIDGVVAFVVNAIGSVFVLAPACSRIAPRVVVAKG